MENEAVDFANKYYADADASRHRASRLVSSYFVAFEKQVTWSFT